MCEGQGWGYFLDRKPTIFYSKKSNLMIQFLLRVSVWKKIYENDTKGSHNNE